MTYSDLTFQAMGSQCRVIVNGDDHAGLVAWAQERVEQLEARWSRFRSDSEISALNRQRGQLVTVSPDTYSLIERAIEGWRATDGRFDPTMLDEIVELGYDRSFPDLDAPRDQVRGGPVSAPTGPPPPSPDLTVGAAPGPGTAAGREAAPPTGIVLVPDLPAVLLPAGVSFDPGGIGKGLGADLVATELLAQGATGAMVDLGGDVRVGGSHPDSTVWTVMVDPRVPGHPPLRPIGVTGGGVATSSQMLRRWSTAEGDRHHLLDPATGRPSVTGVATVVVAAPTTWQAEVVAKAALVAGVDEGSQLIADTGSLGLVIDLAGTTHDAGLLQAASA